MKRLLLTAVLTVLMIAEVHAESFTISDIRVNGLQRVSAGSVFGALPLNVGEQADDHRLVESTRALFKTGFFQDIQLGRDGNVLVITVVERPSVASIEIEGNKAISTEDLMKGLKQSVWPKARSSSVRPLKVYVTSCSASTSLRVATPPPSTPKWYLNRATASV